MLDSKCNDSRMTEALDVLKAQVDSRLPQRGSNFEDEFAHFPLANPNAVVAALTGSFTAARKDQPELVIATCDRIRLFTFDDDSEPKEEHTYKYPGILGMHATRKR